MSHGTPSARAAWSLVLALLVFIALLVQQRASAQSGRLKWEYRVFPMNPADYNDTEDYKEILELHSKDAAARQMVAQAQERARRVGLDPSKILDCPPTRDRADRTARRRASVESLTAGLFASGDGVLEDPALALA